MIQDLYDRWLNIFILSYVFIKGFIDNKINKTNCDQHFYNFIYLLCSEIGFKWIKDIFMIKVSGTGESSEIIRTISTELCFTHDKYRFKYIIQEEEFDQIKDVNTIEENKFKREDFVHYLNYIKNYSNKTISSDNTGYVNDYSGFLDFESLILLELEIGVIIYIILGFSFLSDIGCIKNIISIFYLIFIDNYFNIAYISLICIFILIVLSFIVIIDYICNYILDYIHDKGIYFYHKKDDHVSLDLERSKTM